MDRKNSKKTNDSLENFFEDNKDKMETYEPSPELWLRINNASGKIGRKKDFNRYYPILRLAAVFLAGIFAGWLFFNNPSEKIGGSNMALKSDSGVNFQYNVSLDDLSKNLGEIELFYQSKINKKIKELEGLKVDKSMYEEVGFLDTEYKSLQDEAVDNIDKERVVGAMVQNLRFRLVILETILKEVREKDQSGNIENKEEQDIPL